MVRETLAEGARHATLVVPAAHGLQLKWCPAPDADTDPGILDIVPSARLNRPLLLQLTRRGTTITAAYSTDEGRSYRPAGPPQRFNPPLANTVYAGLAITAHDERQVTEAKFSGLEIRKR
jgi:hypothetical protein